MKAKARAKRRRKAKARAEREAKAPVKTRDQPDYDQKTFEPLNLKTLQTQNYEAKEIRRLDVEIEVPPTYLDSCGRTQTHKVGRREKKYTRWLPDDGEGFMFGEEEKRRAIEREKKWRAEHGWSGDLVRNEENGKGKEATTTDAIVLPAATTTATKRKLGDFEDLPDYKTPTDFVFKGVSHADDAPPSAKRVLRDFTSSCMDGRTIRVYQECSGELNTPRSFAERYPGLTYDTVVQRKNGRPETQTADNGDDGEEGDGYERKTEQPPENVMPPAPAAVAKAEPQPATSVSASASANTSVVDSLNDDFTIHTTTTALMTKGSAAPGSCEDSDLVFTPSDLTLAASLLPHLTKHQRRKLRKRLSIHPPTNTNRQRRGTTNNYHDGGTTKPSPTKGNLDKPRPRLPRRGIPNQPRGPKKSRQFDCRDGVLGNCPPDCVGRLHKTNGKVEQSTKARKKGTLLFGRGVGVGEWVSGETAARARGTGGIGRGREGGLETERGRDWGRE